MDTQNTYTKNTPKHIPTVSNSRSIEGAAQQELAQTTAAVSQHIIYTHTHTHTHRESTLLISIDKTLKASSA
jgi:hypothetical protein